MSKFQSDLGNILSNCYNSIKKLCLYKFQLEETNGLQIKRWEIEKIINLLKDHASILNRELDLFFNLEIKDSIYDSDKKGEYILTLNELTIMIYMQIDNLIADRDKVSDVLMELNDMRVIEKSDINLFLSQIKSNINSKKLYRFRLSPRSNEIVVGKQVKEKENDIIKIKCPQDLEDYDTENIVKLHQGNFIDSVLVKNRPYYPKNGILNLKKLEIADIKEIQNLDNLKNLKEIYLQSNYLTNISDLPSLPNLKLLQLENNKIEVISRLSNLPLLEVLNLSNNKLIEINEIEDLKNLIKLDLHNNKIITISGLKNQRKLKELILSKNQITKISGLNSLEHLEYLIL